MGIKYIEPDSNPENAKIGIVVSKWNSSITDKMLNGSLSVLTGNGIKEENIIVARCPGSFELPLAVDMMMKSHEVDGVIALGVVIRGGTPHFEYVCDAVTQGILDINLKSGNPVAFGVLTTDDVKQAIDRVGEKGNKGGEAAMALLEMISLKQKLGN